MKVSIFKALLMLYSLNCFSQSLPDEMYFSTDGRILYTGGQTASGFYDPSAVKSINLYFPLSNYWTQLQTAYNSKTDLPATFIYDNSVFFDSVGVRFRGMTSYMGTNNSEKKSFNISLNSFIDGQDIEGYNTFNLNNAYQDPSFLREVYYQSRIRKHIPSAKSNFVKLYINGANWGVYANVQQLNKDYLKEWFMNNNGTNWRADRPAGGGGGWGDGTAALNYHSNDTADYQTYYTLKSSDVLNPWQDLVDVCLVLDTVSTTHMETVMNEYMDLDRTLWFLASEIAFSDDDGYAFKGKMDYYVYYDEATGRTTPLEYDGNSVMEVNFNSWSPFYNVNNVNYPLLNKLLAQPEIRQRYLAHLRTIMSEEFDSTSAIQSLTDFKNLIDTMVNNDPKKLYTYTQFNSEFDDLKDWIINRKNFINSNAEVNQVPPSISNVNYISNNGVWTSPLANDPVTVVARATSVSGLDAVYVYYATGIYGKFGKIEMFDDGTHNDSISGDGIYGAVLPGQSSGQWVRFYIEAVSSNTAHTVSYSPAGAEHNVYIYQVTPSIATNIPVTLNEVMASNTSTVADPAGEYDDWIELYNLTNQPLDISGYFLSDNSLNLTKWDFPSGTIIPANGYLIVWADEDGSQPGLHTNFKLSGSGGEHLMLLNPGLEIVADMSFGVQTTDMGYARVPNGTGSFVIQSPTFNANNDTNVDITELSSDAGISVYPNPATDHIKIYLGKKSESMEVFNSYGQLLLKDVFKEKYEINISGWSNGMYFIRSGNSVKRFVVGH